MLAWPRPGHTNTLDWVLSKNAKQGITLSKLVSPAGTSERPLVS